MAENQSPEEILESRRRGIAAPFLLSYGVAAALLMGLVYFGGVWNVLANTRVLELMTKLGVVKYHDAQMGIIEEIPDPEYFLKASMSVDWRLVILAFLIYFLYFGLRSVQFHSIARSLGMKGHWGKHARAYFYGEGLNRLLPYGVGDMGTICALEGQGESGDKARSVFRTQAFLLIIFEIGLFALWGLFASNWSTWVYEMLGGLAILGLMYFIFRERYRGWGRNGATTWKALANNPRTMGKLGIMSIGCMLLHDCGPFVIAMAFTFTPHVVLHTGFIVLQAAVVAGFLARRIKLTPQGIGQYEVAFAFALYVGGLGFPEAATIALLDSFVRNMTAILVFLFATFGRGVETNLRSVLRAFREIPVPAGELKIESEGMSAEVKTEGAS